VKLLLLVAVRVVEGVWAVTWLVNNNDASNAMNRLAGNLLSNFI
jgi:hypothetical protein